MALWCRNPLSLVVDLKRVERKSWWIRGSISLGCSAWEIWATDLIVSAWADWALRREVWSTLLNVYWPQLSISSFPRSRDRKQMDRLSFKTDVPYQKNVILWDIIPIIKVIMLVRVVICDWMLLREIQVATWDTATGNIGEVRAQLDWHYIEQTVIYKNVKLLR